MRSLPKKQQLRPPFVISFQRDLLKFVCSRLSSANKANIFNKHIFAYTRAFILFQRRVCQNRRSKSLKQLLSAFDVCFSFPRTRSTHGDMFFVCTRHVCAKSLCSLGAAHYLAGKFTDSPLSSHSRCGIFLFVRSETHFEFFFILSCSHTCWCKWQMVFDVAPHGGWGFCHFQIVNFFIEFSQCISMASKNTKLSDKMSNVGPRAARGLGHTSVLTFEGRFSLFHWRQSRAPKLCL